MAPRAWRREVVGGFVLPALCVLLPLVHENNLVMAGRMPERLDMSGLPESQGLSGSAPRSANASANDGNTSAASSQRQADEVMLAVGDVVRVSTDEKFVRAMIDRTEELSWHELMHSMLGKEFPILALNLTPGKKSKGEVAVPSPGGHQNGEWYLPIEAVSKSQATRQWVLEEEAAKRKRDAEQKAWARREAEEQAHTGVIRWATHPKKCLKVLGSANQNGSPVVLFDCGDDAGMKDLQFIAPAGGKGPLRWAVDPTKCMDVTGGAAENGNIITIFDCLRDGAHANQQFLVSATGLGAIRWASNPQKCLDVTGGAVDNDTPLGLYDCLDDGTHANMQFALPQVRIGPIRWATHEGKCLEVKDGGSENGNSIVLFDCLEGGAHANMQFTIPASGTGPIRWSAHPNKCLDVAGGSATNGNTIGIFECLDDGAHPNQQFTIPANEKGLIKWATDPTMCVDVAGGVSDNGNLIGIWSCLADRSNGNMQFIISKAVASPAQYVSKVASASVQDKIDLFDRVWATTDIIYGDVEVPFGSFGTIVSSKDGLGVHWDGFSQLSNADVFPYQVGKIGKDVEQEYM